MGWKKLWKRLSSGILAAAVALPLAAFPAAAAHAEGDVAVTYDISQTDVDAAIRDATLSPDGLDPEAVDVRVEDMQAANDDAQRNEANADGDDSLSSHDWSEYVSPTLKERIGAVSENQLKLYEEFDDVLSKYLNNSNVDAAKYTTSTYSYYVTSSIDFGKYGLTKDQAFALAQMFLYNNPQYYFATSVFLTTQSQIWFTIYDQYYDGDVRASATNRIFNELDRWISVCSDYEGTTYMKSRSAHNKIVNAVEYVSGAYDQSIYSALIQKQTVCAGYSKVYAMMMNAMDIDTMTVLSDCHAWNISQLDDGKWYAVDTTWDDSLGDYYFFHVSDASLKKYDTAAKEHTLHKNWEAGWLPEVSDTDYIANYYDTTGVRDASGAITLASPDDLYGQYEAEDDAARVSWSEVAGAAGYEVVVYDYDTGEEIGELGMQLDHVRITHVQDRKLLIKIRAVGLNNGAVCYSDWSQMTYINKRFAVYKEGRDTVLDSPKNFHMRSSSDTEFTLSWDAVDGASGYSIYLYTDPNREKLAGSFTSKGTVINVSNVDKDAVFYAYIRAFKSESGTTVYSEWTLLTISRGNGSTSGQQEAAGTSSSRPTDISYSKTSDTSVRVTWTAGEGSSATDIVIRSDSPDGKQAASLRTQGTVFDLNGMKPGKTYYVCMRTVHGDGTFGEWAYTAVKVGASSGSSGNAGTTGSTGDDAGSTGAGSSSGQQGSFSAPKSVSYEPISAASGRAVWSSVPGAANYDVQISRQSSFSSLAGQMTLPGTVLRIDGTAAGNTYYVRVRAVDASGNASGWTVCRFKPQESSSSGSSGTAPSGSSGQGPSSVATPSNVRVGITDGKYRLTWDPVTDASGYTVEIYKDEACTVQAAAIDVTGTAVVINGMASGHTYYIRLRAKGSGSAVSNWLKIAYTKQ